MYGLLSVIFLQSRGVFTGDIESYEACLPADVSNSYGSRELSTKTQRMKNATRPVEGFCNLMHAKDRKADMIGSI